MSPSRSPSAQATIRHPPLALSALSQHIAAHPPPPPSSHASSSSYSSVDPSTYALALQVQHQLQYQHNWTSLSLITHSPLPHHHLLPRTLIAGLPPKRIYVHPDDQIDEVKRRVKEEDVDVEREWVLPMRLREKWSLKGFAGVFDTVGEEPPSANNDNDNDDDDDDKREEEVEEEDAGSRDEREDTEAVVGTEERGNSGRRKRSVAKEKREKKKEKPRRGGKRMVLATVGEDSTIVYYIMHDGIVKPRQN